MSRREDAIKAVAAALQPKSLDLTDFAPARAANRVRSTARIPADVAAYALGFASESIEVDGERMPGDPLAVALLRLKYAEQLSLRTFERALELLVHRHGALDRKSSETVRAVAAGALIEWLNDRCPECRSPREDVHPWACPDCRTQASERRLPYRVAYGDPYRDPWGKVYLDREGGPIVRVRATTSPAPGCQRCGGLGRIFPKVERPRGVVCSKCSNSGIVQWKAERRWRTVSELLVEVQRSRGEKKAEGLRMKAFMHAWHRVFYAFLDVLRAVDRRMGATIDLNFEARDRSAIQALDEAGDSRLNRAIESGGEEKQDPPLVEPDANQASDEPAEPTGEVPPQES